MTINEDQNELFLFIYDFNEYVFSEQYSQRKAS